MLRITFSLSDGDSETTRSYHPAVHPVSTLGGEWETAD